MKENVFIKLEILNFVCLIFIQCTHSIFFEGVVVGFVFSTIPSSASVYI